jgi:FAD:protein FMN transferase
MKRTEREIRYDVATGSRLDDGRARISIDRREFLAVGIGALLVSVVPFSPWKRGASLFRRTIPVMGTTAEVVVIHRDGSVAHAAIDDAMTALRRVETLMTRFRTDSEVGRINALAGRDLVAVSNETLEVVQSALHWARSTGGVFDPSLARAVELWDVAHRTEPPAAAARRQYAGRELYNTIEIDLSAATPRIGVGATDAAIDLGGIAKGYGVDMAVAALRAHGIEHGLVNAGGDLYALGKSQEGDDWRVGLRSPANPARIERTIPLSDQAVATSGDYMQYFEHGGRRFHHLLDPRTGEPSLSTGRSVTAIASKCTNADAAATAAFHLSAAEAERLFAPITDTRLIHLG